MIKLLPLILSAAPITAFTTPSGVALTTAGCRNGVARRNPRSLSAIKEATFGMGCFWEPAESLLQTPGVLSTTVGYTGAPASKPPPTYDTVCFGNDYVEAVRVVYDDSVLDYGTLLDEFFEVQKPKLSRQYSSIVFVDGEDEEEVFQRWKSSKMENEVKRSDGLPYEIVASEPLSKFYRAEEYHQNYWAKQRVRAGLGVLLIAGASGAYDEFGGGAIGNLEVGGLGFDSICNAVFLVGAAWMILERLIVRDVRELKSGDLILEL